ncbi:prevent-host-death protein [Methylomonas sp. LL1]|uniref:hypothetical protein n=1 Tax=Methylomonas sp. LL1 TaxID=2785785 RepID=UPI0018C3BCFD|nr:hypothetical protein [Methylomonas sp. LL1]QPK62414.1 prevent-host-death protein [Methylomonas sp. LL1]
MLTTVQGHYHHGVIQLDELPPDLSDARVIVTFLVEAKSITPKAKRPLGLAPDRGQALPTDFDAPLPEDIMAAFSGQNE